MRKFHFAISIVVYENTQHNHNHWENPKEIVNLNKQIIPLV